MTNTNDILTRADFNFRTFKVDNVSIGDSYLKVQIENVTDIYVSSQTEELELIQKYKLLEFFKGFIHVKNGLSVEVENAKVKSLRLFDKYLQLTSCRNRKDIEQRFGLSDNEMFDGIMWPTGFVVEANVLLYKNLKLCLHIDPETENLKEIRVGDINEEEYLK